MEQLELLINQLGIPVASVSALIGGVIYVVMKIREVSKEIRGDNYNRELNASYKGLEKKIQNLTDSVDNLVRENKQKDKQIALLTDQIAKVEGYTDGKL